MSLSFYWLLSFLHECLWDIESRSVEKPLSNDYVQEGFGRLCHFYPLYWREIAKFRTALSERPSLRDMTNNTSHIEVILLAIFPILDEIEAEIRAIKGTELMGAEVQRHVVQGSKFHVQLHWWTPQYANLIREKIVLYRINWVNVRERDFLTPTCVGSLYNHFYSVYSVNKNQRGGVFSRTLRKP
jgi:hypothetical protein